MRVQPNDWTVEIVRSARRTLALEVRTDGRVLVRAPFAVPMQTIERFVQQKRGWIESRLKVQNQRQSAPRLTESEIQALAGQAQAFFPGRTAYFARLMGVDYARVTVRCQKTRWGSCSGTGSISYNCLLMLVPPEVRDYVVVHELAHRRHMDHSPAFWAEVNRVLPDHQARRAWLRAQGPQIMARAFGTN